MKHAARFLSLAVPALLGLAVFAAPEAAQVTAPLFAGDPPVEDLGRARQLIRDWEETAPEKAERVMRVVYWTPADREPQPEFRPRLTRVMKSVQDFYATQMAAYGFPGRTIRLELAEDGLLRLPVAKGTLKSAECSETDGSDGQAIRRDCLATLKEAGIDGAKETLVIFCNLADWDPDKRRMSHHSPYYASGKSTNGTAWQLDSPLLDAAHLPVKDQHLDDGQYGHISLGKYNSIFVGGVCHEIGHALGLPHCRECPQARRERGSALMGSGNRTFGDELRGDGKGSFLALPHALKLAVHPQFSGSVKQMNTEATVNFSGWKLESTPEGLRVAAKLKSNLPCHAVLAYGDPEGGGDYDAAIAAGVPLADGTFSLLLPPPDKKNRSAVLSFVGVCVNGAATASVWSSQAFSLPCRIGADGSYDVSRTMAALEVKQHAEAARSGKLPPELAEKLTPAAREALRRLALPEKRDRMAPATAEESVKSLPLSDTKAGTARTGYGGVHYDRTDAGMPLVGPDGPAAHGLWAHANSEFHYDLGGKWTTLRGTAGLLDTGSGNVQAKIEADGRTLWESGEIKPGVPHPFSVEVKGVKSLVLTIRGVKGIGSAHGAWLEPVLGR